MRWIGESKRRRTLNLTTTIVLVPLALVSCGSQEHSKPESWAIGMAQSAPARPPQHSAETLNARLQALDRAVGRWQAASRLHVAHVAAEETRNLIVGPFGPYYRDANGDGKFAGANTVGILPGLKGGTSLARVAAIDKGDDLFPEEVCCRPHDLNRADFSSFSHRAPLTRSAGSLSGHF